MHVQLGTTFVIIALVSSFVLLMQKSERTIPVLAALAAGMEALIAFGLMSLSVAKFRIDVILPAMLAVTGVIAWARAGSKHAITAATLIALVGSLQLLGALHIVG